MTRSRITYRDGYWVVSNPTFICAAPFYKSNFTVQFVSLPEAMKWAIKGATSSLTSADLFALGLSERQFWIPRLFTNGYPGQYRAGWALGDDSPR